MQSQYMIRMDDELFKKFKFISNENSRSINKEFEFVVKHYVAEYEKNNGVIDIRE